MSLLFTLMAADVAPRVGLAIGAILALAGGLASALRIRQNASDGPAIEAPPRPAARPVG
jgi:DHA2 family multidrug resistance protein-like MFS transporter